MADHAHTETPDAIKKIIADFEAAKSARQNFEWLWQEIANLVLPRRDFTIQMSKGAARRNQIFDGVGVWANEQLASALHSFLTNPTLKWFDFKLKDAELNERHDVRQWLYEARNVVLDVFSGADSNFHPNAHELYMDLGAFGTSCMFINDGKNGVNFQTRPLGECYIMENAEGFVDTVMREFSMTARQAVQEYKKENVPRTITEALEKEPSKEFPFLHAVQPREDRNPISRRSSNLPWASTHILLDNNILIKDSGFHEFPFVVPRWSKVAGERFGRGPGMTALPDLKMLQAMSITVIKSAQKIVDPPLMAPDDGFLAPPVTHPGGINYFRASTKNRIEPLLTKGRVDIGLDLMNQRREAVLRSFFIDLLSLREGPQMTATEVMDRRDNRLRQMSPMVSRLQVEFLSPLIQRTFAIMTRRGELPEPPPDIELQGMKIDFLSPAALAQRASELDNIQRWFSLVIPMIQLDPAARANVDLNEAIRLSGTILNVPPQLIVKKEIAEAEQQRQAEALQQQQQMAAVQQGGEAAQAVKEAASDE